MLIEQLTTTSRCKWVYVCMDAHLNSLYTTFLYNNFIVFNT